MGRCQWRTGARLRMPMALVARPASRDHRSDQRRDRANSHKTGLAAIDRECLERGRVAEDGVAALPFDVSVLCGGWSLVMPNVPAERGCILGRAVQYRFVRIAYINGRAS